MSCDRSHGVVHLHTRMEAHFVCEKTNIFLEAHLRSNPKLGTRRRSVWSLYFLSLSPEKNIKPIPLFSSMHLSSSHPTSLSLFLYSLPLLSHTLSSLALVVLLFITLSSLSPILHLPPQLAYYIRHNPFFSFGRYIHLVTISHSLFWFIATRPSWDSSFQIDNLCAGMSNRRSRQSSDPRITDDQIIDLVSKLRQLLPEISQRRSDKVRRPLVFVSLRDWREGKGMKSCSQGKVVDGVEKYISNVAHDVRDKNSV